MVSTKTTTKWKYELRCRWRFCQKMKTEVYTRCGKPLNMLIISEKDLEEDGNTELDNPFVTRRRGYCARRPCEGSNPWTNVKGSNSTTASVLLVLCSWINGEIYKITYYLKNVHRVLTANSKQVSGVLVATWTKRINLSWMYEFKVHSCSWQKRVLILCYLLHSLLHPLPSSSQSLNIDRAHLWLFDKQIILFYRLAATESMPIFDSKKVTVVFVLGGPGAGKYPSQ